MGEEVDPAAEFLAREQSVLADLDDNYKDQKGRVRIVSTLIVEMIIWLMNIWLVIGCKSIWSRTNISICFGLSSKIHHLQIFNACHFTTLILTPFRSPIVSLITVNGISENGIEETNSKSPVNLNGQPPQPEPEKIRIWREEHQKLLKIKDENEAEKELDLKDQAKKELEDWYQRYKQQLSKSKQINR